MEIKFIWPGCTCGAIHSIVVSLTLLLRLFGLPPLLTHPINGKWLSGGRKTRSQPVNVCNIASLLKRGVVTASKIKTRSVNGTFKNIK